MPIPRKFAPLIGIERGDVEAPDYIWLVYAVCALAEESCGWGGWMIEGAFKVTGQKHSTGTGDKSLPVADGQACPCCGRVTFRTGASLRVVPSDDQKLPVMPGLNYEVAPIEFYDPPTS